MTAFVAAMPCEAECVRAHFGAACREETLFGRRVVRGRWNGREACLVVAGIGKSNAAAATQLALSSLRADAIVNAGLSGGFDADMAIGGVYPVSAAVEYDFDLSELNGTGVGVLNERTSPFIPLASASLPDARILATGDRFRNGDADLPLLRQLGAGLRDMEGAAVAHVCETAGVPCYAVKCVVDVHGGGTMTEQYAASLERGLASLTRKLPELLSGDLFP